MSTLTPSAGVAMQRPPVTARSAAVFTAAVFTTAAMTFLFGTEVLFIAFAFVWASAGLLHLSATAAFVLGSVPIAAALCATIWMARRTWRFERYEAFTNSQSAS